MGKNGRRGRLLLSTSQILQSTWQKSKCSICKHLQIGQAYLHQYKNFKVWRDRFWPKWFAVNLRRKTWKILEMPGEFKKTQIFLIFSLTNSFEHVLLVFVQFEICRKLWRICDWINGNHCLSLLSFDFFTQRTVINFHHKWVNYLIKFTFRSKYQFIQTRKKCCFWIYILKTTISTVYSITFSNMVQKLFQVAFLFENKSFKWYWMPPAISQNIWLTVSHQFPKILGWKI